jgi:hypothetical protein
MRLDRAAKDDRAVLIAGDLASGFMTYVARSRVLGFPDAVSIRLHPRGTDARRHLLALGGRGLRLGREPEPRAALDRRRRSVSASPY